MKSINPDIVLKPVKEYVLMAVGMLMYSFGWIGCILPAGGVGGGAAGLSLVLCNALSTAGIDLQIGTMVFIINAVLLLVAGFIVGWNFGLKTIFCVVIISLGMNFWQEVLPDGNFLGVDNLLAIVMGGILAGAGIALCFSQGGSMALFTGLREELSIAGIISLSGYLPLAGRIADEIRPGGLATPVFMGNGDFDEIVPIPVAQQSLQAISHAGAAVSWRDYPTEHTLSGEALRDTALFMRRVLGGKH